MALEICEAVGLDPNVVQALKYERHADGQELLTVDMFVLTGTAKTGDIITRRYHLEDADG